ncbi:UPF0149 family protein [Pseudohaliea rubra]|uniref:Putative conserved exported protein n=1 Tax=Pseudohaliea rubra DSM 19751 TaxID=1265313 RepID=A0A095VSS6_9GAMM|nr:UPF0149 family protein [Pseudohaliea rubra]KGE04098.1 putative conserved exported protein precursor [Pseudohaliea rubra DSM 19751]
MMGLFDPVPGEDGNLPAFDEVADHLLEQGISQSPSELHGCLAGLLAGGADPSPEAGLAGVGAALGFDPHGELADGLQRFYVNTAQLLTDEALRFQPLLPDDDSDLGERTLALADWCRGFLSGFAQARVSNRSLDAAVEADSAEALKDFAAIAQAGVGDDDDDEGERAYADLVEYLRFAAMNIILDSLGRTAEAEPSARPPGSTVH